MSIAILAFFLFAFAWNTFFHPLTFSLYVSMDLKCVSYRQHIYRFCCSIHPASLCPLVFVMPMSHHLPLQWILPRTIAASVFVHSERQPLPASAGGVFDPFMFKVIIDNYDPVAIYLLFWVPVYIPFVCFLSKEDPLAFVGELVWWCWILSAFAYL